MYKRQLRIRAANRPGVLAGIASVLGNNGVGIAQVVQKSKSRQAETGELVIITDQVKESGFQDAMTVLKSLSTVREIASCIRVY